MASINYAAREISVKIVYYGPGLSGKTTNLQIIHKKVPKEQRSDMVSLATETDRTLFFDFLPLDLGKIKGFDSKFQLYTVPGQVYYNATRKLVLRGVDGIVFVADSAEDKMDENLESYNNMLENLAEYGYKLSNIPVIIQYNKRDLPNALSVEALNEKLNPDKLSWNEAVAFKGKGVFESLKIIGKSVIDSLNKKYSGSRRSAASRPSASPAGPGGTQQRSQPSAGSSLSDSMRPPSVSTPPPQPPKQPETPGNAPFAGGPAAPSQPKPSSSSGPSQPGAGSGPIEKGYGNYMSEAPSGSSAPQQPSAGPARQPAPQQGDSPSGKSSLDMELEKYESRLKNSGGQQQPSRNPAAPQQGNPFTAPGGIQQQYKQPSRDYNPFETGQQQSAGFNAPPPGSFNTQPPGNAPAPQQQFNPPPSGQFQRGGEYKQPPLPQSPGSGEQQSASQDPNRDRSPMYFTSVDKNKKTKKHKRPVNPKEKQNKKGFFGKFFNRE